MTKLKLCKLYTTLRFSYKKDQDRNLCDQLIEGVKTHIAEAGYQFPRNTAPTTYGPEANPMLGMPWEFLTLKKTPSRKKVELQYRLASIDGIDVASLSKMLRSKASAKDPLLQNQNLIIIGKLILA